ncbi:MAG: serine peptidase [Oceanospirillaceae bacterium]|uniref:DegQ family serine endoprotease n=1 Tax=unclassified Thalassolituus TaxID=2624967 RepID=UPI000C69FC12|nr:MULTISPECIES: DegQ family serine endoprotease [unclassified Thalassolituus]MAS23966.1 serine peptidase [Oceanospirillaceae bacterium]MAY00553.1 serine peptidase [Oceanospirillaceae bacterium]MBS53943.1 serine peptidase [Oceanospirillaceae bacterium]|tara:strand:- start:138 stop:1532 length:1395 start_codon:yes stop_codon:yes gene_type:complete
MSKIYRGLAFMVLVVFSVVSRAELPDFRDLVKETSPAVVNISTVQHIEAAGFQQRYGLPQDVPEIFRHFFGGPGGQQGAPGEEERASLGSGFIISDDGYILTNNHVVKDADEIVVRLNDRRELDAKLIGADESSDLALLKVEAKDLPTVELGNSDKLDVGEWVVAIGSPFGFDYSVTAGIVSAKGRSLPNENYVPFIQTDVAINPGNSGGPLFNLDGEVVGINSQIYTRSGGFMGVSFAIPINVALDVADQLKEKGKVSRGWLGVVIQEVSKDLAESFGLDKAAGALVAQVVPDSPAEAAGLESGDIITRFDGKDIYLSSDLPHQVGRIKPGEKAKIDIVRNGKRKTLNVEIGVLPDSDGAELAMNSGDPQEHASKRLGVVVAELSGRQRKAVGDGVIVKEVKRGPAAFSGLVNGDIITNIAGDAVTSVDEFERIAKDLPANRSVPMRIVRRGSAMFIPLRINE